MARGRLSGSLHFQRQFDGGKAGDFNVPFRDAEVFQFANYVNVGSVLEHPDFAIGYVEMENGEMNVLPVHPTKAHQLIIATRGVNNDLMVC